MAQHPGDDGKWHTGRGPHYKPIKARIDQAMTVTSPAVIKAMRAEEAFLASIPLDSADRKRFTDRRPIPGRNRLIP